MFGCLERSASIDLAGHDAGRASARPTIGVSKVGNGYCLCTCMLPQACTGDMSKSVLSEKAPSSANSSFHSSILVISPRTTILDLRTPVWHAGLLGERRYFSAGTGRSFVLMLMPHIPPDRSPRYHAEPWR